jgi:twitching motility two-component system response regulator PilH
MPKGSRVLMADDDNMLLDMYKERLELAGYNVESHGNGEELLAHVQDFNPDIIMLDVMMPKMNGYETLASLKSDPTTKSIPVVMLSALMRDFNREKAVEGGAEDYLIKSEAMPSDVIMKIEQVLQKYGKGLTPVPGVSQAMAAVVPPASEPSVAASQPSSLAGGQVVFEPAASEALAAQTPPAPVNSQSAIETQPQINMPKTEATTPAQPASLEPKVKPDKKNSKTGLIIVIIVIVLAVVAGFYYFLMIKK